jgi:hypothetical protein
VARGRPNDRPALFGSAEGMLIKGYSIGKSPFDPTHPSLGPLFLAGAVRSSARRQTVSQSVGPMQRVHHLAARRLAGGQLPGLTWPRLIPGAFCCLAAMLAPCISNKIPFSVRVKTSLTFVVRNLG